MHLLHPAFIQGLGGPELLIILAIILLLFGAKKLPELAKGLGKSMKEFKKAAQEVQDDFQEAMDTAEPEKKPAPPAAQEVPPPAPVEEPPRPRLRLAASRRWGHGAIGPGRRRGR